MVATCEDILEWFADSALPVLFVALLLAGVLAIPCCVYSINAESKRPEFSLKKDDWSCSAHYSYITTTYVMAGKVLVPVTQTHTECQQYTRTSK